MRRRYNRRGQAYRDAPARVITSNRDGHCVDCGCALPKGSSILWEPSTSRIFGMACEERCGPRRQEAIEAARLEQLGAEMDELANETRKAM